MGLSEASLTGRGLIPAEPIRALVERWNHANPDQYELGGRGSVFLSNLMKVCEATGLTKDFILNLLSGRAQSVGFDKADRIVCHLSKYGAYGWHVEPGLKEIYDAFDLSSLDRKKPTVTA